ncbi:MSHA biogenesis protein MshK [Vibrio fluminensis]|uniref:MSHA biogenesis protein MshK n=1 Tax=Vibrio fluminensis TaxID=2783614 RepID=UPI001887DED9
MANKSLFLLLAISSVAVASQDPTAPLNWQSSSKSTSVKKVVHARVPNLQSIVCGENEKCFAILDGQTKAKGDKVAGFNIQNINADYVTVSRGNKMWKLELFPLEVKQ